MFYEFEYVSEELLALPSMVCSNMQVTGLGKLVITNTGGSSASEGGMGTGGGSEQGAGIKDPGNNSSKENAANEKKEESWDPLKPKEEKEKGK